MDRASIEPEQPIMDIDFDPTGNQIVTLEMMRSGIVRRLAIENGSTVEVERFAIDEPEAVQLAARHDPRLVDGSLEDIRAEAVTA